MNEETPMRLWLLTRTDGTGYDEHFGAVVRAETEERAREIAAESLKPPDVWLLEWTVCEPLTDDGESGVVLDSFNAA